MEGRSSTIVVAIVAIVAIFTLVTFANKSSITKPVEYSSSIPSDLSGEAFRGKQSSPHVKTYSLFGHEVTFTRNSPDFDRLFNTLAVSDE